MTENKRDSYASIYSTFNPVPAIPSTSHDYVVGPSEGRIHLEQADIRTYFSDDEESTYDNRKHKAVAPPPIPPRNPRNRAKYYTYDQVKGRARIIPEQRHRLVRTILWIVTMIFLMLHAVVGCLLMFWMHDLVGRLMRTVDKGLAKLGAT